MCPPRGAEHGCVQHSYTHTLLAREASIKKSEAEVRRLSLVGYLLALYLVITPLLDALTRILPVRPGEVGWRFGAMGLVFNTLVTPLLGLFLAMLAAVVLGHRRILRGLGVVSYTATVTLALGLVLFMLDYVQARAGVVAEQLGGVDIVSWKAVFLGAVGMMIAGSLGRVAWKASRTVAKDRQAETLMVVGTPGESPA